MVDDTQDADQSGSTIRYYKLLEHACLNAGKAHYQPVCDLICKRERCIFGVCEGCVRSYKFRRLKN